MTRNKWPPETPSEFIELSKFAKEFQAESDRGAALVAASLLDERLKDILQAFFADVPQSQELLEGFNAPLGTFSARINAAYSLGLLQENEYGECNIVRRIRNEFGHKWKDVSFDSPSIKKLCDSLPRLGPPNTDYSKRRRIFNFAVIILVTDLMWRATTVIKEKRTFREWPNKLRK